MLAFDKLTWRALWWFRFAAMFTVASGLLILLIGGFGKADPYSSDYWKSPPGAGLACAILFALIMLYNVLGVIWPNQQIVIANARNVQAGGEPDPKAPAAARAGAMASRQNTIFSFTVFLFMVGSNHLFNDFQHFKIQPAAGVRVLFYIVLLAIAVGMEANVRTSGRRTAAGGTKRHLRHPSVRDLHRGRASDGLLPLLRNLLPGLKHGRVVGSAAGLPCRAYLLSVRSPAGEAMRARLARWRRRERRSTSHP